MRIIKENDLRYLCEAIGNYMERRYEIRQKNKNPMFKSDVLEFWTHDKEMALRQWELYGERPVNENVHPFFDLEF